MMPADCAEHDAKRPPFSVIQAFYKKALLTLILLLIADALIAGFCIAQSYPSMTLIPQERGGLHSRVLTTTDAALGGTSAIRLIESGRQSLRFGFKVTNATAYPFVSAQLLLEDGRGNAVPADLSRYTTATFVARCAPANALLFTMQTFDPGISKPGEFLTYPSPETYFACSEHGTPVSLDLTRLALPPWWFDQLKIDPLHQSYTLERVAKFEFGVSLQSPREADSDVEISDFTLHGRDERYLVALALILAASLGAFVFWFFRAHTRALVASLESHRTEDMPLMAYRQLTLEPFKDKEKTAILQFVASHYTDPELDLDGVAARIGANRDKINDILKMELGMTFTSYLNKLRLTEAARLLAEKDGKSIADIAHAVGYANVSYFNKLFKQEYGCTPSALRSHAAQAAATSGHDPAD
jgi:AraC-like DNA-binding protein